MTININIGASGQSYCALVGVGLLGQIPDLLDEYAPAYRYAVTSDAQVSELYAEEVVSSCRSVGKMLSCTLSEQVKLQRLERIGQS